MGVGHTPTNLLHEGGSDFFSAKCKAELAKLGYDPDEFGSYNKCSKHLSNCRDKVAKYDAAVKKGKKPLPPKPTPRERELGQPTFKPGTREINPDHTEAGHLKMNTTQQTSRGDPCSNVVDGHSDALAPCMPHNGPTTVAGSEHNLWTVAEVDKPTGGDPAKCGQPYTGGPKGCEKDADQRCKDHLARREATNPRTTGGAASASSAGASAAKGADAKKAAARQAKLDAEAKAGKREVIDGKTAAECINNFRKRAEAQMKNKCKEDAAKNGKIGASAPKGVTKKDLDAAKEKRDDAAKRAAAAKKKMNEEGLSRKEKAARKKEYDKEKKAAQKAQKDYNKIGGDKVRNARCLKAQADRLKRGEGIDEPRNPPTTLPGVPRPGQSGADSEGDF